MNEKQLTEERKNKINKIKQQWADEIGALFDKWDDDEKMFMQKNPKAPRILDKHLREQIEVENKYKDMIRQVMEE